jgi:multidrug efflux system outer membrane protein
MPSLSTAPTCRCLLPVVLTTLLAACSSLPPTYSSVAASASSAPKQWTEGRASAEHVATDLAQWWTRFSDPQLTTLINQALLANSSVHSAQAALRQARAQADIQNAGLGPNLGASGSAQRGQSGSNSPSSRFQLGLDASWEPDIFGGHRSAADAGEADAQAAAASLSNVQVSLAAEVASNYIGLRSLQKRIGIAQDNLRAQQETLQITQWRAQAGLASSLDVEQAVSATEQTRAQLPSLQASASQAMSALAVLVGQVPGSLNTSLATATAIPLAPGDIAIAFPAETLRQRPDVRAAELRISAAVARVAVADAARYPSVNLGSTMSLSALTLGTLTNGASLLKSVVASMSVPLFDGGARSAQVRSQEASLQQARVSYQAAVLSALQDVENALVGLRGNRDRLGRLQAAASAAGNAELLARQRYQSGLIDFATVLTTQRTLLSLQDSVATTQGNLSTDHVKLYKALGGGWEPTAPTEPSVNVEAAALTR